MDTRIGELSRHNVGGQLAANLLTAGYNPDQIDAVLITHFHGDYIGGLMLRFTCRDTHESPDRGPC